MITIRRITCILTALLILTFSLGQSAAAAETAVTETEENAVAETAAAETEETVVVEIVAAEEEENALEEFGTGETDEAEMGETDSFVKEVEAGTFLVRSESTANYRYENGRLSVYGGTVTVKTKPEIEYSTDRIEVSGYAALELDGVRIKAADGAAIRIQPGADAEIRLAASEEPDGQGEDTGDESGEPAQSSENIAVGADGYAGIEVGTLPGAGGTHALSASLRITGAGMLTAEGGSGAAAIGGSRGQDACGIIEIKEGNIKAVAGNKADGIGCCADSTSRPAYAPVISDKVASLLIFTSGEGAAITAADKPVESEEEETDEPGDFSPAEILIASFAESGDGNLDGLTNVRIKDTAGRSEILFDMPAGYRSFAVKTEKDCEYMIEQGGRVFAKAEGEEFSGETAEEEDAEVVFRGVSEYNEKPVLLVPVEKSPSLDIEVTGEWEDEDDSDGTRPESILITLYANGRETGRTITLSEENDWYGVFEEMAVYRDSVRQSYSIVEERLSGYTGLISGSDQEGYTITNEHSPLPEGRSAQEEIDNYERFEIEEGVVIETILTTKISRSMPARTSTTIAKTRSAKTADASDTTLWGGLLLLNIAALYIWMRVSRSREQL